MRLAWLLLCAGLAACDRTSPPAASAPAALSVVDSAGHTLRLAQPAQRVATPGISMASLILVLSSGQQLVAVAPEVTQNPWLRRILPGLAQLPTPFTRPAGVDLEALLATHPDLVTLWSGNAALGQRIEEIGIPVMQLSYTTPQSMQQAALALGSALGPAARHRAEEFVAYYQNNLARVSKSLADLPEAARPKVYYASLSPLLTEGRDSMVDAWIRAGGGINVAATSIVADAQVHFEDVLKWNPDVIVTLSHVSRDAMLADPRWRDIRAVREGRVLVCPRGVNAWCTRASEAALQVLWAARMFHPERFSDLDMAHETRAFYRQFYNYRLDDNELARVLQGDDAPDTPLAARSPA